MEFTGERVVPDKMAIDVTTYIQHLARYVFALRYCVGKTVLDAACGTGYGTSLIQSIARSVVGFDIDQDTIDFAKQIYESFDERLIFKVSDFETADLSFSGCPAFYDTIVSFETIEHLSNPGFFLRNVKDRLVPGGKFVFSIPRMSFVQFHKQVYDLKQAQNLIRSHFKKCDWYGQTGQNIGEIDEYSQFFIGIATK